LIIGLLISQCIFEASIPIVKIVPDEVIVVVDNDREPIVHCLATMIYGEAAGEPELGKIAVAYTAKNRAKGDNKGICKEVLKPMQYSVFNGNAALKQVALTSETLPFKIKHHNDRMCWKMTIQEIAWEKCKHAAELVYDGLVKDPAKGATGYIAPKLMALRGYHMPHWTKVYEEVITIKDHVFFRPATKTKVIKI
jgi:hypothetical protein